MKCPFCSHEDTRVADKRELEEGSKTRRRRECLSCKKRFTTYEHTETVEPTVLKKDSTRESFNRQKILMGFLKACEKRPISREIIEQNAKEVEHEILNMDLKEVPSKLIGEIIMNKLKQMDKVAYIRFASVYKQFADVDDFKKEMDNLLSKNN